MEYYSINTDEVLKTLNTSKNGLTTEQVQQRFNPDKMNKLHEGKKKSLISKFFAQFSDIMVIILLIAAVVSITLALVQKEYGDLFEGGIILLIVILNATMGVIQENKAENALESLKKSTEPYCEVIRDNVQQKIKTMDLVCGDIVVLDAGDIVPADLRLIETHSLKIDEASLTGESLPIEKNANLELPDKTTLHDRKNMAYSGTVVAYGRGIGVVTQIGTDTEFGKISVLIQTGKKEQTPLQKSLTKIGKIISYTVLAIAVVIFLIELLFSHQGIMQAFLTAVALAVAAIPESLPASITIIMALSVQKLAGRNAIIKRLHAVETLGSCQVICSDKTGTLTQNKMTVKKCFYNNQMFTESDTHNYSSKQFIELYNCMTLCNDSTIKKRVAIGDPTETALINFGFYCEQNVVETISSYPRVDEIPFDSNRKLMTTINKMDNCYRGYTKGAVDCLLNKCTHILVGGKKVKLTKEHLDEIEKANSVMAEEALRVLGFAYKEYDYLDASSSYEENLVFLGLVGMIDPPRPETIEAIKKCFNASLKPVMITGDHAETAFAVAKTLGMATKKSQVITGEKLSKMSDSELVEKINKFSVFARVSPEHKVRIVKAFQKQGKVVAMTGDGVNDAPSLKIADIGVGMGVTGTDVTKDVADMIIADDNFATIILAIEEGRKIYSNIQKTIQFLLSTNMVEVITLFLSCIFLPQLTFLAPSQLLFINFITDSMPAISLGLEPAEYDIMDRPPRENSSNILSGGVGYNILYQAAIQVIIVMLMFVFSNKFYGNAVATTMVFFTINLIQIFHSFNLKTNHSLTKINIFKNKVFNLSVLASLVLVALVGFVPFLSGVFGLVALTWQQWLIVLGGSFLIIPLVELSKFLVYKLKIERVK